MEVKQLETLVNGAITDSLGGSEIALSENLENVVDVGTAFENLPKTDKIYEKFTGALVNQIGKLIVVNRSYTGNAPSVLMDSWQYGSILEKITSEMPKVTKNESWDLKDGTSYDPHIFHSAKAEAKFYNSLTTFEIDRSIVDRQIRQSFQSASQLNAFVSMLFNETQKALTVATEDLIYFVIGNMIANSISNADDTKTAAINLIDTYKAATGDETIKADTCIYKPEFIRHAAYMMSLYQSKMSALTTMFNLGGKQRFTSGEYAHIITLADFMKAADIYLQSDTYHDEYTRLTRGDTVPYWQAPGATFSFKDASTISLTPVKPDGAVGEKVTQSGILGVIFDRDALGVANFDRRVTTEYNPKAEFTNYFYKQDARYFNDFNEQFLVFYVKDSEAV